MMKLVEYSVFGDDHQYRTIRYETEAGYKIEITLHEDGIHDVECESATFDDLQEVFDVMRSGKLVIEL